jgi:hypothetical protein
MFPNLKRITDYGWNVCRHGRPDDKLQSPTPATTSFRFRPTGRPVAVTDGRNDTSQSPTGRPDNFRLFQTLTIYTRQLASSRSTGAQFAASDDRGGSFAFRTAGLTICVSDDRRPFRRSSGVRSSSRPLPASVSCQTPTRQHLHQSSSSLYISLYNILVVVGWWSE